MDGDREANATGIRIKPRTRDAPTQKPLLSEEKPLAMRHRPEPPSEPQKDRVVELFLQLLAERPPKPPAEPPPRLPAGLLVAARPPARPSAPAGPKPGPQVSPLAKSVEQFGVESDVQHTELSGSADLLGALLGSRELAERLETSGWAPPATMKALASLSEQAITMGIDYGTLGLGWDHPVTRTQYREGRHPSTMAPASRRRAEASRLKIMEAVKAIADGRRDAQATVTEIFLREIGLPPNDPAAWAATFPGVAAALDAELLLPLRALQEGQPHMHHTFNGESVPPERIAACVRVLTAAVLSRMNGFSEWRYSNRVGQEQLRGLTEEQIALWRQPTSTEHDSGVRTHEDSEGELGFFWATKIGGPSHGFDYEAQCLLPLLANARHKVILVSDPVLWPFHPMCRAHWRLLWTALPDGTPTPNPEPRLWLEAVNADFGARSANVVEQTSLVQAVLRHALSKSDAMRVPLSVELRLTKEAKAVAMERDTGGVVWQTHECFLLRPSNGVCEASDYLSNKHDWVQLQDEVTEPLWRALYVPAQCASSHNL
mmetsp:Transcript_24894/g.65387  ORF Transcript_24894/g.65387 Transcript_24894/m.65387 type:complete len:545 (-) Transcript_24894:81-1715(-)